MKNFFLIAVALIAALVVGSCGNKPGVDEPGKTPDPFLGKVQLSMSVEGEYEVVQSTKSDDLLSIDLDDFKVVIYNAQGTVVAEWAKYSEMPEFIELTQAEAYKIVAFNSELQTLAFDAPYFSGEATFDIVRDQITPVDITAKLGNAMITITPTQEFKTYYGDNYRFIIRNDEYILPGDPELIFMPNETRSGYVKPAPFSLIIETGSTTQTRIIENVNAQDHHKFNINVVAVGAAGVSLSVDRTTNDKDLEVVIPGGEEDLGNGGMPKPEPEVTPDPEDPEDPGVITAPDVQLEGLNIDEVITVSDATDIVDGVCIKTLRALVTAQEGIKSLVVRIDSPDLPLSLLEPMFGGDSFDLANLTPELHMGLAQLGLITEDAVIKDQKSFSFEITSFMSLLPVNSVHHKFHVTVVDNKDNSVVKTLSVSRTL